MSLLSLLNAYLGGACILASIEYLFFLVVRLFGQIVRVFL